MAQDVQHGRMRRSSLVAEGALAAFFGLIGCLLLAGCGPKGGPPPSRGGFGETNRTAAAGIDVIRVGDRLRITFTDIPTQYPPLDQQVRDDGSISLPLNQRVIAAGKRVAELEAEIHRLYVPKFFRRMTVNVQLQERVFVVGGQVRQPGRFAYIGEMTLLDAIRVAGDFTEFADRTEVQVVHSDGKVVVVNCKQAQEDPRYDVPIYPGDKIFVPRRIF